ncbi:type IV secretory system conjugative DNA transfer family protein [Acidovorax temperans]|uniref:type IV secretory system conjugative DNA transfer family protein n=1 Tax=Acidovorax temperans TaxID=80878 RepID=UPI00289C60EA|nr:type IV secretory system conjugative DNA transfer family protein [Acidovorax temperans]
MRLTLDHLAATGLAAVASAFTALASSALALRTLAERNGVPAARVLRVAWERPAENWPDDLQIAASLIICVTFIIGFLSIWFAWGHQFIQRPRDLSSVHAAKEILSRSSKGEPRIFGGIYESQRFFASIEDRGLVVGPPGTGKTAFLCNQVLSLATQKTSFVAVDIKPELHKLLSASLEKSGYRVVRLNPAIEDPSADHWNPLAEIFDETALFELCAALLPVRDPREAPFIESQRD